MFSSHTDTFQKERILLLNLSAGDERAFRDLYLYYSPAIYRKLLQLLKREELAEEVLQDVFVRIWEKRAGIDSEKSFRSYLYRIAQNMVTDLFRRAALDRKMLENFIVEHTDSYDPFEDKERAEQNEVLLNRALETLPAQRRKIYQLIKLEGKSYDEVSQMLGISGSTINDHVVKATKAMKAYFNTNDAAMIAVIAALIAAK